MKAAASCLLLVLAVSSIPLSSQQKRNRIMEDDELIMTIQDDDLILRDLSQTDDRFNPTKNRPCFGQNIPSSAPVTSFTPWDHCSDDEGGDTAGGDGNDDGGTELNAGTLGPFFSPVVMSPPTAVWPTLGPLPSEPVTPTIPVSAPVVNMPNSDSVNPAPVNPPAMLPAFGESTAPVNPPVMLPAFGESTAPVAATQAPADVGYVFNFNFTSNPSPSPSANPTPIPTTPFTSMEPSTDSPTMAISHWPTQTPLPTPLPWLDSAFYDPYKRKIIRCDISCALPILSRRRSRLLKQQDRLLKRRARNKKDHDESDDEDREIMDLNAAKRFKREVADVMMQIITEMTEITVMREDGFRRRRRHRRQLREYRPPTDYVPEEGIQIVVSKIYTNVTRIFIPGPRPGSKWWLYSVGFWTVEENTTSVLEQIGNATQAAVRSGEILRRLRPRFQRIVAVSLPGEEEDAMPEEVLGFPGDADVLELREWDTRRWIGLALFSFTLIGTLALTRIATYRRKRVRKQEEWGVGLSSETDINQLLTYGWEFDGQQVHAFDKSKLVYRDDDSMFIGGAVPLAGDITAPPTVQLTSSSQTRESHKTSQTPSQTQSYRDDPSSGMGTQQDSVQSHSDERGSSSGNS